MSVDCSFSSSCAIIVSVTERYYDTIKPRVLSDKEAFMRFASLLFDELDKTYMEEKWNLGEDVHGVLTKEKALNTNWFHDAKQEVADLEHYRVLHDDNFYLSDEVREI